MLNLTRQATVTPEITDHFKALDTKVGKIVTKIIEFYNSQIIHLFGPEGASIHDQCAVAWLIDPTLIEFKKMQVEIELKGEYTRGMTVCDMRNYTSTNSQVEESNGIEYSKPPNVEVGIKWNSGRLFDMIIDAISKYS